MNRTRGAAVTSGLLCLALLLAAFPAYADDGAKALLDKHRAFMGWAYNDGTIKTLVLRGKLGEREFVTYRRGAGYRTRLSDPKTKLESGTGYLGNVYWLANENGWMTPRANRGARAADSLNFLFGGALPLLEGTLRASGVVRVKPPAGAVIDATIEADGKLAKAVIDPDSETRLVVVITRYAQVLGGKNVIADYTINGNAFKSDSVEANSAIPEADFQPPHPTALWEFAPDPRGVPIDISLRSVRFEATVNGVRGTFLLDSGASFIALTPAFARRLNATELGESISSGVDGVVRGKILRLNSVEIGNSTLKSVIARSAGSFGDLDGLMGFDLLAGAIVDVDIDKKTLTVLNPEKLAVTHDAGISLIVDLDARVPFVDARLNDSRDAYLMLDTGNAGPATLAYAFHDLVRASGGQQSVQRFSGAGGTSAEFRCGYTDSLAVGPIKLKNPSVCFFINGSEGGIVGFELLRHYNWTFDYPNARWLLTRNKI